MGKDGKKGSIEEVKDVTAPDHKWAEDTLKGDLEGISFLGWVNRPKGKSFESRLVLVSKFRLYVATSKYKTERDSHLADIKAVESSSPDQVTITFEGWNMTVHTPQTDDLINSIVTAHTCAFPGMPPSERFKVAVEPSSRVRDVPSGDSSACGGFVNTYRAYCDYFQTAVREDIVWDVQNLFTTNNITEFNLEDLEQPLSPEHLVPLFAALRYNTYFTGLIAKNITLDVKKTFPEIGKCLSCNTTITKLVLPNTGMTRDAAALLADGIKSNPNTSINVVDFSQNPMDDKAVSALAACIGAQKNGLIQLNLARCGISKGGMSQLGQSFRKNVHMTNTLSSLIIPSNHLDSDGSSALASWLACPNKLTVLNIANTNANLDTIMPALVRGCNAISTINVSGNKISKKTVQSLTQFLQSTDSLTALKLANTSLAPEDMVAIIQAIGSNPYLKSFDLSIAGNKLGMAGAKVLDVISKSAPNIAVLNLSDNDFPDEAISLICKGLISSTSVTSLDLSRNFSPKASKARDQAIEDLIDLVNSECPLEQLIIQGNKTNALKNDILPLIDGVGTNDTLLFLDVSSQQIGNKGAIALSKMLQTNRKLKHLVWEDNGTTLFGFNAVAGGLERNKFLKEMPIPILDVSNALKGDPPERLQKCVARLQSLLARNQNPKALMGGGKGKSFNQFSILSSGDREHVERLKFKIKSSNKPPTGDQKVILEDAENNDNSMASIYNIAEGHQSLMADEITAKLRTLAKDIMPVVDKHFAEMVNSTIDTVSERYKSLDPDAVRRIKTSISFGVPPLEEKKIEDILANAASAEIASKSNEVFTAALEITTDYIYEKLIQGLITIVDDVKQVSRPESVALFDSSKAPDKVATPEKPKVDPKRKDSDSSPSRGPPTRGRPPVPTRGSPGGGSPGRGAPPVRARGAPRGRGVAGRIPDGLDPSKMLGGRGFGLPPVGGPRSPAAPAPQSPSSPPVERKESKEKDKPKKGLFGKKTPKAKPKGGSGGGAAVRPAPPVKKVSKPSGETENLKVMDQAQKEAPDTTALTHATRERPMATRNRRPPTRRPRAKAD